MWLRDGGKCTEPGCGATKYLHYDHVQPFFLGGGHSAGNLRLLCSAHHGAVTREVFGGRALEARACDDETVGEIDDLRASRLRYSAAGSPEDTGPSDFK